MNGRRFNLKQSVLMIFATLAASGCGGFRSSNAKSSSLSQLSPALPWNPASSSLAADPTLDNDRPAIIGSKIGFNTFNYLFGYVEYMGYPKTADYANNTSPFSLPVISSNLAYLNRNGIHIMREIVPELGMEDTNTFYPAAVAVMREFQKNNFTLLLALGRPAYGQDLSNGRINCMLSRTEAEFQFVANRWAETLTGFMVHVRSQPAIDQTWFNTHVLIDPYNEFDSLLQTVNGQCPNNILYGTPERAAVLQRAIADAFARNGLTNEITTPSAATGGFDGYFSRYYAAGGQGRPNIHTYFGTTDPATIRDLERKYLTDTESNSPAKYAGRIILGEVGLFPHNANHATALEYLMMDPVINSKIETALWWDYSSPNDDSGVILPTTSPELSSFDIVGQTILAIASGYATLPMPTMYSVKCSSDNTHATLSWGAVGNAQSYALRVDNTTNNSASCGDGWICDNTDLVFDDLKVNSFTLRTTPGVPYQWWVHSKYVNTWTGSSSYSKVSFTCGVPAPTPIDSYLVQLYQGLLGRAPDSNGYYYWKTNYLNYSCAQMAVNFLASSEFKQRNQTLTDQEYLNALYKGLLGRDPDAGGLSYWVGALVSGFGRENTAASFLSGSEFSQNCISRYGYSAGKESFRGL